MKRSRQAICEAVRRVQVEELLPVAVVAKHLGEPPPKVVRWIIRGTRGVHLDGVHNPTVGWQSSIAAAERFRAALAAAADPKAKGKAVATPAAGWGGG